GGHSHGEESLCRTAALHRTQCPHHRDCSRHAQGCPVCTHWFAAGNPEIRLCDQAEELQRVQLLLPRQKGVGGNWILPAGNRIKKEPSSWQTRTLGGQYKRQLPCDYHSARIL